MRGLVLGGAAAATLMLGLACGGVWNEAMAKAVDEKVNEYTPQVAALPDGAEKARVEAVLQGMRANNLDIGVMELAGIEMALKSALDDGAVDDAEASDIERAFAEAIHRGPDSAPAALVVAVDFTASKVAVTPLDYLGREPV